MVKDEEDWHGLKNNEIEKVWLNFSNRPDFLWLTIGLSVAQEWQSHPNQPIDLVAPTFWKRSRAPAPDRHLYHRNKSFHRLLSCPIIRATLNHWVQTTQWKFVLQKFKNEIRKNHPCNAPPTSPPSSPHQSKVTLLSRATWLIAFALRFAKTALVCRRKNSLR